MSPGINPGDIAVVQEVPAASLQQGEVATVQREGSALPVTHRVVGNVADPADPQKVLLTMKGDANSSEDPVRYNVHTAKRLLFSVPALGHWVMRLQTPGLMGVCTVVMASLVTWTFWPKNNPGPLASLQAGSE
ncbi:S26 family signal peptidase [Pseudarthrobacter sp. NamE2]|nr:S26 family signal peptidase [Pseudarthrobacter sp. NamE2]